MINEHDCVVLTQDLPSQTLKRGRAEKRKRLPPNVCVNRRTRNIIAEHPAAQNLRLKALCANRAPSINQYPGTHTIVAIRRKALRFSDLRVLCHNYSVGR